MTNLLQTYLSDVQQIYSTGAATKETSFYTPLANLFNRVGDSLKPKIKCVVNIKNQGADIPDGGFFTASQLKKDEDNPLMNLPPERGVLEVKSAKEDVEKIARSEQVEKYLRKYGQVLVTNLRDFLLVAKDESGVTVWLERFTLAETESEFREMLRLGLNDFADERETRFAEYLKRVFLHAAPIAAPEDVAFFLASYARDAKARIEANKDFPALENLKNALAEALGIAFTDEKGEKFFRSTLVQTLFYGIFSAWVLHSRKHRNDQKFDWHTAAWELRVPMIRALFEQIATPSKLKPLGLTEVLDWTSAVLNRVNKAEFFQKFEQEHAVQYFYEPFLQAFDPELRKQFGVWYTPKEIVRYMVERVDRTLREELNIADGLANENVFVLDPCCGTGAYLVEVLRRIDKTFKAKGEDALSGNDLKRAACERIFGFEILPAPFVVAHLQLGLILQNLDSPLDDEKEERVGVYLTNALTGWNPAKEPKTHLLFPEMEEERDRAEAVKLKTPILVILGNPPYDGFAGVAIGEERELSDAYRTTRLAPAPQGQGLNELYVRFFRMAERKIAEMNGQGVVCYISNYSWLEGLSHPGMREKFLEVFDEITIDCLNGDKFKTGKLTPEGKPDPSVFSTEYNREGIQVGTAIATLVRKTNHQSVDNIKFRNFWGKEKRQDILESLAEKDDSLYQSVPPVPGLALQFSPSETNEDYFLWALLPELFPVSFPGVKTSRDDVLVAIDRKNLIARMEKYFDANISHEEMKRISSGIMDESKHFEARKTREQLIKRGFKSENIVRYAYRPFDVRWLYWEGETKLLDRNRADFFAQVFDKNCFIVTQQMARRKWSSPQIISKIGCLDLMDRGASCFPLYLNKTKETLFDAEQSIIPNLSETAANYLAEKSGEAADLFFHSLAILHSPDYRREHASALRQNFPRIPLPEKPELLQSSALLGKRIAALLDTEQPKTEIEGLPFAKIGVISRVEGGQIQIERGELEVKANWGYRVKTNVQPGKGKAVKRDYTPDELKILEESAAQFGLSANELTQILGAQTFDVYLNDAAFWRNIPEAVWNYTIGGYQVLKKWLSYREADVLGRSLTADEAREVSSIVRRISAILLLSKNLDANYNVCKNSVYDWQNLRSESKL